MGSAVFAGGIGCRTSVERYLPWWKALSGRDKSAAGFPPRSIRAYEGTDRSREPTNSRGLSSNHRLALEKPIADRFVRGGSTETKERDFSPFVTFFFFFFVTESWIVSLRRRWNFYLSFWYALVRFGNVRKCVIISLLRMWVGGFHLNG